MKPCGCGADMGADGPLGPRHALWCPEGDETPLQRELKELRIVGGRLQLAADTLRADLTHPEALGRAAALSKGLGVVRQVAAQLDRVGDVLEVAAARERHHHDEVAP